MMAKAKPDVGRRMLSYYADSADIDKLSPRAENLFTRLLPLLDDFGNHWADPTWLRVRCFPRKQNWKNQAVKKLRDELVQASIVVLYGEDGYERPEGPFIHYVKFEEHQTLKEDRRRSEVPRYLGQRPVSSNFTYDRALCPPDLLRTEGCELTQVPNESTKTAPKISKVQVQDKQEGMYVCSVTEENHTQSPVQPEYKSPVQPENKPIPAAAPTDIRDWAEDRFGIPAPRLRACIAYQLDHVKNDWYRANLSAAALGREAFVKKLDADTPAEWAPPKKRPTTEPGFYEQVPDPACTRCQNGKIYKDGQDYLCPCNHKVWVTVKEFYGIA